jgi:hypothetical protein
MRYALIVLVGLLVYSCGRDATAETLEERVRAVLGESPPSRWDADERGRDERLDALASIIADASSGPLDAAILLALGWHESRFAGYVGRGCRDIPEEAANCDGGRARSYWQAWRVSCRQAWELPRGSEQATRAFAACALRRFHGSAKRCHGRHPAGHWAGAFSGYRSVDCTWRPGAERARTLALRRSQL